MDPTSRKRPADDTQPSIRKRQQTVRQPLLGEVIGDARIQNLKQGTWSDFKIACQGHTFEAHRIILTGQSPFIDKVIEGGLGDTPKDQLDLTHEEKETVATVLWFMYTGEIGIKATILTTLLGAALEEDDTFPMVLMMKVHQLADYLIMPDLKAETFRAIAHAWKMDWVLGTPTSSPLSQSRVSELRSIVDYAMGSTPPLDHIVQQLCWVLVTMNGVDHDIEAGKVVLDDEALYSMTEAHPGLCSKLSISRTNISIYNDACSLCSNYRNHTWDERRVQVTDSDKHSFFTIKCICNFQGFCSSTCLSNTLQTINAQSWCEWCDRNLIPRNPTALISNSMFSIRNGYISALSARPACRATD